ncbi:MAG TPA: ribonuclease H [Microbacteriaceae bacterium]|nr:ribonuclease H [Microbacteriaceae bacterium]
MTLVAAADGSALGNPGPAGWAWYINDNQWRSGGWKRATNNQGELMAVLSLLQETRSVKHLPLTILCDSQYVINAVTVWIKNWKKNNWRKANGKPVLNADLIRLIDQELQGREITFEWVKGHSGHFLNEKVDSLAKDAASAFATGKAPVTGPGFNEKSLTEKIDLNTEPQSATLF